MTMTVLNDQKICSCINNEQIIVVLGGAKFKAYSIIGHAVIILNDQHVYGNVLINSRDSLDNNGQNI